MKIELATGDVNRILTAISVYKNELEEEQTERAQQYAEKYKELGRDIATQATNEN